MGSSRKIMELASLIMVHTKEIDSYLVAQGLPSPSFEIDAAVEVVLPENLMRSRDVVLDALEGLHAHIAGPLPQLMRLTSPAVKLSHLKADWMMLTFFIRRMFGLAFKR